MKKKITTLLICLVMLFIAIPVEAAGSLTVSTGSLSITQGSTKSFTIKANNSAGRVDISTSNAGIAKISTTSSFLDNSSVTVKVTGVKVGTATITIKLTDVATYDGQVLSGTRTVKINVVAKPAATPVKPKVEEPLKVTGLNVIGYPLGFEATKKEYAIDVEETLEDIYVEAASNGSIAGAGKVNIKDKEEVNVTFTKGAEAQIFKIKINRHEKEKIVEKEIVKEVQVKVKEFNIFIITTMLFFITTIVFGLLFILSKLGKKKNKDEVAKE